MEDSSVTFEKGYKEADKKMYRDKKNNKNK
jgi:hypothetical protein